MVAGWRATRIHRDGRDAVARRRDRQEGVDSCVHDGGLRVHKRERDADRHRMVADGMGSLALGCGRRAQRARVRRCRERRESWSATSRRTRRRRIRRLRRFRSEWSQGRGPRGPVRPRRRPQQAQCWRMARPRTGCWALRGRQHDQDRGHEAGCADSAERVVELRDDRGATTSTGSTANEPSVVDALPRGACQRMNSGFDRRRAVRARRRAVRAGDRDHGDGRLQEFVVDHADRRGLEQPTEFETAPRGSKRADQH